MRIVAADIGGTHARRLALAELVPGERPRLGAMRKYRSREAAAGLGAVRKVSFGVGVERTFPLHSPIFEKVEVITRGDVRRAKLYYLRNLRGKAAKIKERREA